MWQLIMVVFECLVAIMEEMKADQKQMIAKMKTSHEGIRAEMKATQEGMVVKMDSHHEEFKALMKATVKASQE